MISKPSRLALPGMAFACAALLAACSDSTPRLQFVTVAPVSGEIYVSATTAGGVRGAARSHARPALQSSGNTGKRAAALSPVTASCGSLQYAATGLFSNGTTQDLSNTATWSSSDTAVATVSSSGLASGVGLGTTNIGASFKGVSSTAEPLAVDQLNSISVSPNPAAVLLGSTVQFAAAGNFTFAAGGTGDLDVSSQVTWASSNPDVATIDSTGNATAVTVGSTNITATSCGGTVGTAVLTVNPTAPQTLKLTPAAPIIANGTTVLFTALELLSDGTTKPLTGAVTWSSGTTTTATIDPNTGVALGVGLGFSTITATEAGTGFTGTATLTVQAAAARFAYIGNLQGNGSGTALGSGTISGYTVDVTGATLTPLTGSPFNASNPQQVLIHPSGDLMFYINASSQIVTNFVDSQDCASPSCIPPRFAGELTYSNRAPSTAGTGGTNVGVIDPLGRFIYVIEDSGTIYGYSIAQTQTQSTNGVLTMIGTVPYTDATLTAGTPSWVMTDRAGKYLYVVNATGNTVSEFSIDQSTGAIHPLGTPTIPTGNSPNYATTDTKGHIYVANSGDGTVSVFSIDGGTGQLSPVGSSNFAVTGAGTVFNVLTDPTAKFLYILDSPGITPGKVFAFNLDPTTGAITTPTGTPPVTGTGSIGMAIDPTGALLLVDNNVDYTISLYSVSTSTGALTVATPATVSTDSIPQFVTFYTAAPGQ